MALKIKEQAAPAAASTENPLARLGIAGNPLATVMEAERHEFLPYAKVVTSIEKLKYDLGNGDKASATHKFVITGGGTTELVPAPYLMTVLWARGGTRELVPNNTGGKSYARTFVPFSGEPTAEHIKQMDRHRAGEKDAKGVPVIQVGNCYAVAILNPAEGTPQTCTIALLEAYNVQTSYWEAPCAAALINEHKGIVVKINDHECNETVSKKDKTRSYYDPRKFTQWSQVALTGEQKKLIHATVAAKEGALDNWLKR